MITEVINDVTNEAIDHPKLAYQPIHKPDKTIISVFEHQRLMASDFVHTSDFAWLLAQEFEVFSIKRQRGQWQLKVGHYIGIIILPSAMVLEILPKPITEQPLAQQEALALTRQWVQRMLSDLMQASTTTKGRSPNIKNIGIKNLGQISEQLAALPISTLPLSKWLLNQFMQLLSGYQPTQQYQATVQNQALLQGKLLIKEQLRCNNMQPHKFVSEVSALNKDMLSNRLIKSALLLLAPLTPPLLSVKLLLPWHSVTALSRYELAQLDNLYLIAKRQLDLQPLQRQQLQVAQHLLDWAYWLLQLQRTPIQAGSSLNTQNTLTSVSPPRLCLLINMNQAFEKWVSLHIEAKFSRLNYEHQLHSNDQYKTHQQSRDIWLRDESGQTCLCVQPDLLVYQATADSRSCSHVIDIKWKHLADAKAISASDAYQLTSYAQAYQAKQVWLVYPVSDNHRQAVRLRQRDCNELANDSMAASFAKPEPAQLWLMPFNVLSATLNGC